MKAKPALQNGLKKASSTNEGGGKRYEPLLEFLRYNKEPLSGREAKGLIAFISSKLCFNNEMHATAIRDICAQFVRHNHHEEWKEV